MENQDAWSQIADGWNWMWGMIGQWISEQPVHVIGWIIFAILAIAVLSFFGWGRR